jgi:UDP-2,3-diacylglucosamine hydrolase
VAHKTLFISDLHLDPGEPAIAAQFMELLAGEARDADALYILGDLFEAWIGDDDPDPPVRRIVQRLRELTDSGVPCFVMHGNRDFMLGELFARESGCRLIADRSVIELYGEQVLLMHGDALCTDDISYQRLRRIVRNPLVQWILRHLSLKQRQRLAARMRAGSRMHTTATPATIMDVNPEAVAESLAATGVTTLIHGHTHRPAIHTLTVAGRPGRRIVLGDWYTQGSVLEWTPDSVTLRSLPRA